MDESTDSNSNQSPPSRRKNLIPGIDDAHLALGGVGVTLLALGIVSWPNIQDWVSKTFKMPVGIGALPNGQPANGNPPQPAVVPPPPPAVLPERQPQQQEQELPYPYLRRNNIGPVGQAVSVSAMETVPDNNNEPEQQPQPQKRPQQQQGYNSPFGASISV